MARARCLLSGACEAPIDPLTAVEKYAQHASEPDIEAVVGMYTPDR